MDQHYVPRVYLKQFENSRKMLYTLPNSAHKHSPRAKEVSRSQIGYLPNFYTIHNAHSLWRLGLTDKDAIEKEFNARVENRFEKLIAKLLSPSQMLSTRRGSVANVTLTEATKSCIQASVSKPRANS